MDSRVPLHQTPSRCALKLLQRIKDFLHDARNDPALSPQVFNVWLDGLAAHERPLAEGILDEVRQIGWPCGAPFFNIVALAHWSRERRGERANSDGDRDSSGSGPDVERIEEILMALPNDYNGTLARDHVDEVEGLGAPEVDQPAHVIDEDLELVLIWILAIMVVTLAPVELTRFLLVMFALLWYLSL